MKGESEGKFQNKDLEQKTTAIQSEFDKLLDEMLNNRHKRDTDDFYQVMNEQYGRGP